MDTRSDRQGKRGKALNKKLPQVSIVVPAYNAEHTLEETIESVLSQTFPEIEVIAIDDGSTDATGEILEKFAKADKRVKVVNTSNQGLSAARNLGIDKANGRWILFLDADDLIVTHCLETLMKEAAIADADLVLFDTVPFPDPKFSSDSQTLKKVAEFSRYYDRKAEYFVSSGPDMLVSLVKQKSYLPSACLYLVRKDLLQGSNLRFHEAIIMEDNLFTPHVLASAERAVYSNQVLHRRRLGTDSITSRRGLNHAVSLLFIAERLARFASNSVQSESLKDAIYSIALTLRASALKDVAPIMLSHLKWGWPPSLVLRLSQRNSRVLRGVWRLSLKNPKTAK